MYPTYNGILILDNEGGIQQTVAPGAIVTLRLSADFELIEERNQPAVVELDFILLPDRVEATLLTGEESHIVLTDRNRWVRWIDEGVRISISDYLLKRETFFICLNRDHDKKTGRCVSLGSTTGLVGIVPISMFLIMPKALLPPKKRQFP